MVLPPLYPIIDFSCFTTRQDPVWAIVHYAEELMNAGLTILQLRDKSEPAHTRRFLSCARELRRITMDRATLIINDRIDLCLAAEADGVHLGQDDLSPAAARKIFDSVLRSQPSGVPTQWVPHPFAETQQSSPKLTAERVGGKLIGFSTHNLSQISEADLLPVDYLAIGPVFATGSKANPDPVVGLDGVRQARKATQKPLVAIGGITRHNCRQVKDAGADSVAVISDLLESPVKAVTDFLRILG